MIVLASVESPFATGRLIFLPIPPSCERRFLCDFLSTLCGQSNELPFAADLTALPAHLRHDAGHNRSTELLFRLAAKSLWHIAIIVSYAYSVNTFVAL